MGDLDCRTIFKVGMLVKVGDDLLQTDRRFTSTDDMRRMRGTIQEVESVAEEGVRFKGYIWHGGDLIPLESKEETPPLQFEPLLFDPKELVNV